MSKFITHFNETLKGLLKKKLTTQLLRRLAIILLFLMDIKAKEISAVLKCSPKTVYQTIRKFKSDGIMNLLEKPRTGRKSLLNLDEVSDLKKQINLKNSQESQAKVVHVEIIKNLIYKNNGKKFSRSGIYSFCKKIGLRKVKPRPLHVKNDPEVIAEWRKNFPKVLDKVKREHPDKKVIQYFQDETRFGQKTITSGIWSPKGVRPEYKNENGFLNSWIYGAINTETGKRFGLVLPTLNSENMQIFLNAFSRKIKRSKHVLMILNGSRAHNNCKIVVPKNIALHFLPPYSPQLNHIERLWSYLKRNHLSFKLYEKIDDIIQAESDAWNKLTDKIVKSIGFSQSRKRCVEQF
ncbi:IS630 family transposase [Fluviispira sanaruensis]|uniref:IS630 family transposase ISAli2 n=1 Tax=Fluviispira sanaruensis TaxID=2493639 RepID=A0A4P2VPG9_FLUSA|nr:IS630 family transposase [Fluviispira sanaruensis]BBH54080.1 IS630 family transposase ISAli2 [Fluviispira sanaruensis]